MSPRRILAEIEDFLLETATDLITCTSWLWGLLLCILKWIQTSISCFGQALPKPLPPEDTLSTRSQVYETMFLKKQLDHFDECPIQMTPMLEPVRIVHEDEDARVGQPAHIMDLEAANRWLFECEAEARCPFCRGVVLHIQAEPSEQLNQILPLIAEKTYTNLESVAHKAVRLGDSRLLAALSRLLPANCWRDVLLQKNQQGKLPFELVPETLQSEEDVSAFYQGLSLHPASDFEDFQDVIVHSGLSARFARGCEVWSRQDPSDPRPVRPGDVAVNGTCLYYLLGSMCQNGHDQLLLLRYTHKRADLCRAPLRAAFCQDGRVPELYEPGVRLSLGATSQCFSGRQDVRIGGSPYLDDFVIKGLPPKAAVLRHSMAWCLGVDSMVEPVVHLEVQESFGNVLIARDGSYELPAEETTVTIQPLGLQFHLRPCFLPRRAVSRDFVASLQEQIPHKDDLRQRLVLVRFELEQFRDKLGHESRATLRSEHTGAITSEFTVGRRGASSLVIPMAANLGASVSRHHCCIHLKGDHLVAYDGGSMCGTKLNGKALGNSISSALPVAQGDILALGDFARLRLAKVSSVLQADDHNSLAAFFSDGLV